MTTKQQIKLMQHQEHNTPIFTAYAKCINDPNEYAEEMFSDKEMKALDDAGIKFDNMLGKRAAESIISSL